MFQLIELKKTPKKKKNKTKQYLPKFGTLGFTANVKPRKQSSGSAPKSDNFSSRFGCVPVGRKGGNHVRGVIICYIQMDKISKILNHINVGLDLKCQEEPYPCYSALAQVDRVVNEEPNQPIQQTYVNNSDFIK